MARGGRPAKHVFPHAAVGVRLRAVREREGKSQTEFARSLGFKYQSGYQKLEAGQWRPGADVLTRLRQLYGVTAEEILVGPLRGGGVAPDGGVAPSTAARPPVLEPLADLPEDARAVVEACVVALRRKEISPTQLQAALARLCERPQKKRELRLFSVAAGSPIEAIRTDAALLVDQEVLGDRPGYALEIRGDSMEDAGIHDGDVIIVEENAQPADGTIAVVRDLDTNEVTLKRIYRRDQGATIELRPASGKHRPRFVDATRVEIDGVFVGKHQPADETPRIDPLA